MTDFAVRSGSVADLDALLSLRRAVAAEGRWIGAEVPLDEEGDRLWLTELLEGRAGVSCANLVAADGEDAPIGFLGIVTKRYGVADLGMLVEEAWRGRGVGTALLVAAIEWARADPSTHKIGLQHWPHNVAAHRLYRRHGFAVEGYLHRHYTRRDGEQWDAVVMGLVLDP